MLREQSLLANGQRASEIAFGLLVVSLRGREHCQVIETARGLRVLCSQEFFLDLERLLKQFLCPAICLPSAGDFRQGV